MSSRAVPSHRTNADGAQRPAPAARAGRALSLDGPMSVSSAIQLQRLVGNRATRQLIARDEDPGPPEPKEIVGLSCGVKNGKPFCTIATGKGEPLEFDPSSLSPDERKSAFDAKRPKSCPPNRWNWMWESCCIHGKHFDSRTKSCVADPVPKEEPIVIPPAPPEDKGDFPLPDSDQAYA